METPVINPNATVDEMELTVGDHVCYIQHWMQEVAHILVGEITEICCPTIVKVDWLDGTERLQFVRHLVPLEGEEIEKYVKLCKDEILKQQVEQEREEFFEKEAGEIIKEAAMEPQPPTKRKRKTGPTPPKKTNPLKKSKADSRPTGKGGSIKERMLRRRQ